MFYLDIESQPGWISADFYHPPFGGGQHWGVRCCQQVDPWVPFERDAVVGLRRVVVWAGSPALEHARLGLFQRKDQDDPFGLILAGLLEVTLGTHRHRFFVICCAVQLDSGSTVAYTQGLLNYKKYTLCRTQSPNARGEPYAYL